MNNIEQIITQKKVRSIGREYGGRKIEERIAKDRDFQKKMERGMWQFFLDHAVLEGDVYRILFRTTSKENILGRIRARASFNYKREDDEKVMALLEKRIQEFSQNKRMLEKRGDRIQSITKCGTRYEMFLLYVYKRIGKILHI